MPIRPEEKHRYPKDWPAISKRIREKRAGNRCEECGVRNGSIGGRDKYGFFLLAFPLMDNKTGVAYWPEPGETHVCGDNMVQERLRIIRIVLTVGHLNHKPEDCSDENLKAWCQRCHLRYDAKEKARGIQSRRRAARASGELFETAHDK